MKKIYSKFTKERDKKFQIETAIYLTEDGKKTISKKALLPEGEEHIEKMLQNYQYFKNQGICLLTPDYLPKAEELACGKDSFDNTRWILFDETAVSQQLAKDGSFEFFANSFMIEAE